MWDLLAALAVGYGHELLRVERLADGLCTCAGRLLVTKSRYFWVNIPTPGYQTHNYHLWVIKSFVLLGE